MSDPTPQPGPGNTPIQLPLLCFNDVYRVTQRYVPQPGAPPFDTAAVSKETGEAAKITVAQFGRLVQDLREQWAPRPAAAKGAEGGSGSEKAKDVVNGDKEDEGQKQEKREGLTLFAGDVFNPSVESSVTRGSHMVPVLNMLGIDVACIGNHDFDFGYPHLTKLLASTNFPWLLSNIVDVDTGVPPVPLRRFWVTERCGVKIGVVGLVEEDWISTIPAWPSNFKYRPMNEVAIELSKELRDPKGEAVDVIIALTHCRVTNDITLCNQVGAVADPEGHQSHGVDLVVGGHDHMYYIGKGATSWDGFAGAGTSGTSLDTSCHLIKSGTDFRDLSSCTLTLTPHPSSIRRRLITQIHGKHHYVLPSSASSPEYEELIDGLMDTVGKELGKPVAYTLTEFDALSENVRTRETGLGNWVADVLRHAYAESGVDGATDPIADKGEGEDGEEQDGGAGEARTPTARAFLIDTTQGKKGRTEVPPRADGGADAVIICGGGLRGDSRYGPGKVTMGDILEILPYDDPIVCIELDGKGIRDTLEHALSKWPAQEGRFPIVSGIAVEWDHSAPPYQRVKSIHFTSDDDDDEGDESFDPLDLVEFVEQKDGSGTRVEVKQRKVTKGEVLQDDKVYRVITRDYMAGGGDGFSMLKDRKFIVDDENGQPASSILRSFLLGSSFIFRHQELMTAHSQHLSKRTTQVLHRARDRDARAAARGGAYSPSPSSSLSASPQASHSPLFGHGASAIAASAPYISPGGASVNSNYSDASSQGLFGGASMHGSVHGTQGGAGSNLGWNSLRRHVVKHDRNSIRDALLIGRTEHMSGVDTCVGDELRSFTPRKPRGLPISGVGLGLAQGLSPGTGPAELSVPAPAIHKLSLQSAPRRPLHVALEPKAPVAGTGSRQAGDVASRPPPPTSKAGQGEKEMMEKVKHDAEEDERKQRQGVLIRDDLRALGAELAIICPLVDGRMKDLGGQA